MGSCRAACGPLAENTVPALVSIEEKGPVRVAIATSDGKIVDSGFGNASRFDVYSVKNGEAEFLRTVIIDTSKQVAGGSHREHIESTADLLNDCSVIIVKEIGHMPSKLLAERGKTVRIFDGEIVKETFETS